MLEVEEGEEPGWYWSDRGDVLVDVLPDRDWLPDVDWLSDADWLLGADWLPGTDWLCPEGDIGEVCGGQVTEGSTTRLPWSSKMALAILRTFFSTDAAGFGDNHSPSISEKLSALVDTKY